jgi:maltooligosyltrehalose synthase
MEDPEVWETTHAKVVELARDGLIDGVRIDHPDGLANPRRYLERLHEAGIEHIWIEKILEPGEELRDWPVEGTVGYEFLNDVTALFVDPAGEEPLTRLYEELTGDRRPFAEHAHEAKLREARSTFAAEAEQLGSWLPFDCDFEGALASFGVYRTYVEPDLGEPGAEDRARIVEAARRSLADEVIAKLPNRYEQVIGKRFRGGIDLSGGEWQKIAIARAYMRDAQVLILDEPTAALDARSEFEVFQRFRELSHGKTAVLISHRFSSVRMADRIVVLAEGTVEAVGTHDELLRQQGRYAELFELQAAGYR